MILLLKYRFSHFFLTKDLDVSKVCFTFVSELRVKPQTPNIMNQEELNQLHGLLTTFKRRMMSEEHTMEDLHAVLNTAFIVSETKPNA